MRVIITYDVTDNKRRGKLHRFLRELGVNTQKSVFECDLNREELQSVRKYCGRLLNNQEDALRIYHICRQCMAKAEVQGKGIKITQLNYQVV